MISKLLRIQALALLMTTAAFAQTEDVIDLWGTGYPWTIMLQNDASTSYQDRIAFVGNSYSVLYYMDQAEVTPSMFALTYNTLKDYLLLPNATLVIARTGSGTERKIVRVQLRRD